MAVDEKLGALVDALAEHAASMSAAEFRRLSKERSLPPHRRRKLPLVVWSADVASADPARTCLPRTHPPFAPEKP